MAQYDEFSIENRVENSGLILKGRGLDQYSFKREGKIYTASKIDVCQFISQNSKYIPILRPIFTSLLMEVKEMGSLTVGHFC